MYTNFGGHPSAQRQAQQRAGPPPQPASPYAQLLHFVPVLILIAFTFMSTQSGPVRRSSVSPTECDLCPAPPRQGRAWQCLGYAGAPLCPQSGLTTAAASRCGS